MSKELHELFNEFWAWNWEQLTPPGAPTPMSNDASFADFTNWLAQREFAESHKSNPTGEHQK